jgi:hypothetical protein
MRVTHKNVGVGLGDENYSWVDDSNSGITGVDFRRKCVVVHVGSSSSQMAYHFARHVADAIASVN